MVVIFVIQLLIINIMYIVAFNQGRNELTVDEKSLSAVLHILENNKTSFTVSDRAGKLSHKSFGWGIYVYWVQDWNN